MAQHPKPLESGAVVSLVPKAPRRRPPAGDYVELFHLLSTLGLEIRRHGPSAERMAKKAILELAIGNVEGAISAAKDCLAMTSDGVAADEARAVLKELGVKV
jgi:hypothetical protein